MVDTFASREGANISCFADNLGSADRLVINGWDVRRREDMPLTTAGDLPKFTILNHETFG